MRVAVIYIIGAVAVATFLGVAGPFLKYRQLSNEGVRTEGTVVRPDCLNHASLWYRFHVADREYTANDLYRGTGGCPALKANDPVQIYYLPNNPNVSMSGNPAAALSNELATISAAAVIIPALVIIGITWKLRRRRRA
jgi:hypothetical protein